MANNNYQFTVTPSIPNDLLCGLEGHLLSAVLSSEPNDGNTTYFYSDDSVNDDVTVDDDLLALVEGGSGPIAEKLKALDLENKLDEEIILANEGIDYTDLFAELARQNPEKLPRIEIQGCWHCSKMRPGEFGGFAAIITPAGIESVDTAMWLRKRAPQQATA